MQIDKLVNLTPHAIRIVDGAGELMLELPPSGDIARVSVKCIPVFVPVLGSVEGLPLPRQGVGLVVSQMVRVACPARQDLFSPGELRRDADGKPVGCWGLDANPL